MKIEITPIAWFQCICPYCGYTIDNDDAQTIQDDMTEHIQNNHPEINCDELSFDKQTNIYS